MKKNPFVSILLVNYNGNHLLDDCLGSLKLLSYPKKKYEIIVVDNNSQDDSVNFIKKNYPFVKVIESKINLGFAGGNNLAYSKAKGEHVVLLNNDTVVDKNWLKELVKTAQKKSVGIVSSKLLFDIPFIELEIISTTEVRSNIYADDNGYAPMGLIVDDITCSNTKKNHHIWHKRGFYENIKGNYSSRWTDGHGIVLLPFIDKKKEVYRISLHGHPHTFDSKTKFEIKIAGKTILKDTLPSKQVKQLKFEIKKKDIEKNLIHLVQNAGNNIFKNGLGRDRGSLIKKTETISKEFYDYDSSYYKKEKKLVAMCGASCLIKRKAVKSKNLFDPRYFMYYEDLDLSLKIWRLGYDIIYQPKSIVYHKHRATTNEQPTAFFISNVERNHLFFLLTHFPLKTFFVQFSIFIARLLTSMTIVFLLERINYYEGIYKEYSIKLEGRLEAFVIFRKNFAKIYSVRKKLKKNEKRGFDELYKELY